MFGNALMGVSGRITDIICIVQITCKFINNEENKSRSRHNVEGSFLCVLYFGWPNQPSSGTMIILHWCVIFMLHVV